MGRRFFRHGELPLVLLVLLEERSMHAYDLMTELESLFAPAYSPSPGSIYPAVDALEAEGLIEPADDGRRTSYRITGSGMDALEKRRDTLAVIELRTGVQLSQRANVTAILGRFAARVHSLASGADAVTLEKALDRALVFIQDEIAQQPRGKTEVSSI